MFMFYSFVKNLEKWTLDCIYLHLLNIVLGMVLKTEPEAKLDLPMVPGFHWL